MHLIMLSYYRKTYIQYARIGKDTIDYRKLFLENDKILFQSFPNEGVSIKYFVKFIDVKFFVLHGCRINESIL